jgi:hypothetical protein
MKVVSRDKLLTVICKKWTISSLLILRSSTYTPQWKLSYSSSEDVEDVEEAGMLLNQFSLAPWRDDAGIPCSGAALWYQ